jgi:FkbM family methyltransferase
VIEAIKKILQKFGIGLLRYRDLQELRNNNLELVKLKQLTELQNFLYTTSLPLPLISQAINAFPKSKSQLQQDIFALIVSNFKSGGYFVEFGATDGITLSNTYSLEKNFGWNGILAEPARGWKSNLLRNRNAIIETRCVWSTTGNEILFNETKVGELSTVDFLSLEDMHSENRKEGQKYKVETVSLLDLLIFHRSPKHIDFLSIDTEGSEFEILNAFDFGSFTFGFICCEHNFTSNREMVFNLLTSKDYIRVFSGYSKFDDWYIHSSVNRETFQQLLF